MAEYSVRANSTRMEKIQLAALSHKQQQYSGEGWSLITPQCWMTHVGRPEAAYGSPGV